MLKYKGQSLAIVLVLLIVGSIIGFALYARFVRESGRVVDEKASAESNELTETIIGLVSTSNYEKVKDDAVLEFLGTDCDEDSLKNEGCRRSGIDLTDLTAFFSGLDIDVDFAELGFDFEPGYCLTELAMRYRLPGDEVTVDQDDAYSIFLNKVDWPSCNIDFVMTDNGNADGFVMSTFYKDASYKDYDFNDILGFSYFEPEVESHWTPYNSGLDLLSFPAAYPGSKDGFSLDEVRFKSLGGSSNLRWDVSGTGCSIDDYLMMEVGATCGGKYVGKNFVIPAQVFAPPVFDYVLFNGEGELIPEAIEL